MESFRGRFVDMVSHQVRNIQMLDTGLTAILEARKRRSGFAKVILGVSLRNPGIASMKAISPGRIFAYKILWRKEGGLLQAAIFLGCKAV